MAIRLLPREEEFFDLFVEVATRAAEAAGLLYDLFTHPERQQYCVDSIKRLENEADDLTHELVNRLDRTFITPIDREDIHLLASDLDDVIDRIDGTARRAEIFRLGPAPAGIADLCDVVRRITAEVAEAVRKLRGRNDVMKHCIEAKRLEEEGDAVYHEMLGRLFDTERDPIAIIKWKEIYDNLETAIDEAEDVANDLESIVIKHA
ncbi:MAG: phosphate transport regulator [Gemmatimonadales bacterium]|nr:MAG: phosphate transport regulator [Gemmatimonadales bacterium]